MATYHDPISLLRDYTINDKKIDCVGKNLYFGNLEVNLSHPTAWKPKHSGKQYTIGALWLFLKNKDNKDIRSYIKECSKSGVEIVSRPDYQEIISYFTGQSDTAESIDEELRMNTLIEKLKSDETKEEHKSSVREVLERPLCTKESILQTPNANFAYLIDYCKNFIKEKRKRETSSTKTVLEEVLGLAQAHRDQPPHPIIIVPSNPIPGNLSLQNAKEFLEKGNYHEVTSVQPIQQPVYLSRNVRGKKVTFEIYDSIMGFTKKHWRRVVAVFVQGPRYQFKDWPSGNDLVNLFLTFKGFYLKYQDVPMEDNVKRWNVKVMQIHRNKRHFDKTVQHEFWAELDKFLFSSRHKSI